MGICVFPKFQLSVHKKYYAHSPITIFSTIDFSNLIFFHLNINTIQL